MRKIIWYILLLGTALLFPVEGVDVGKLIPVELIQLNREGDRLLISTDAGVAGAGATIETAIQNMNATAEGIVFLDTADYMLVTESAERDVEAMKTYLKSSVRVCGQNVEVDLKEAARYLRVHKPRQRLGDWEDTTEAELLTENDGKLMLGCVCIGGRYNGLASR